MKAKVRSALGVKNGFQVGVHQGSALIPLLCNAAINVLTEHDFFSKNPIVPMTLLSVEESGRVEKIHDNKLRK